MLKTNIMKVCEGYTLEQINKVLDEVHQYYDIELQKQRKVNE